ncbi:hypothetical protein [Saliphagus sp. LR7]|uniref:hypothetical protein n=1 Tax=Saliphagus sp. LR7 TaxID=2282654 RepID=UPI00130048A9|nr:hypothetical protein [Saliphagus sp. LR7]
MAAMMVVVGSQPALGVGLAAVPGFIEPLDSHGIGLKDHLNDVSVGVIEITTEISSGESSQIAHPIDEKLRISDAVILFEVGKEAFGQISSPVFRKSCVSDQRNG